MALTLMPNGPSVFARDFVSATLAIYLDIYNVFQSLLALLGIFGGRDVVIITTDFGVRN